MNKILEKYVREITANVQNAMWRLYQDADPGSTEPIFVLYNFLALEILHFAELFGTADIPSVRYGYFTEAPYASDIDYSEVKIQVAEGRVTISDEKRGFLEIWDPQSPHKDIDNT